MGFNGMRALTLALSLRERGPEGEGVGGMGQGELKRAVPLGEGRPVLGLPLLLPSRRARAGPLVGGRGRGR